MFRTFKIALRFLLKHKEYSVANIAGLTLSLTCVVMIGLYLHDELSFDRFHRDSHRIYRVVETTTSNTGEETSSASVAFKLSTVQEAIPEVENAAKTLTVGRANVSNDENTNVFHKDMTFADQAFFEIFDFPLAQGDRNTALTAPNSVVITEKTAEQIFGTKQALGKVIKTNRGDPYQVTGVLKDFPSNSHLDFEMLYSMASVRNDEGYKRLEAGDWSSTYFPVYYKLREDHDPASVASKLDALVKNNRPKEVPVSRFTLQPLAHIHFHSASIRGGFNARPGEISYLYIFGGVGLFVLIIACANYVNLSTAFSITRGKEVGVKKVAGAMRSQLIRQFLGESLIVTVASVTIALFFVNLLLPLFNNFTGKTIEMSLLFKAPSLAVIAGFTVLVSLISGSYPAAFLSRLKPAHAIKGYSNSANSTSWLRKSLVVFQFSLSIALIIASITAYRQIEYIRGKQLGFNQDQLVVLDINSGLVRRGFEQIKSELSRIPATKHVAVTSRVPGEWKNIVQVKLTTISHPDPSNFFFFGADEDFLKTFEVELVKGRNFLPTKSDSVSLLVNETAAKLLGLSDAGEQATIPSVNYGVSDDMLEEPFQATVVGIVKDFHFQSLHQKIEPLVIGYRINPIQSIDYFAVRLAPNDWNTTREAMQKVFYQVDANHPLEYNFLDQRLEDFYRQDILRGKLFGIAAIVSIGLACLGLFSLVSFNTALRTKEIGIRKTLGATVSQITLLLSTDYVKLVALGFLVSIPFSVWALQSWLSSFAYRINVDAWILISSGVLSIVVTFATVGFKSVKAAQANPVKALRSE